MEVIMVIAALLAGWAIRKESARIYQIRKINQAHSRTLHRIRREQAIERCRLECWAQIGDVHGDFAEVAKCCR